jgi:hypothetical protein
MLGKTKLLSCAAAAALSTAIGLTVPAAAQESCGAAVENAKAEWRALTAGNHSVAPAMRISTSDGRQLTGSQLNYAWILIDRADQACIDPEPEKSLAYIRQVQTLLHPSPHRF